MTSVPAKVACANAAALHVQFPTLTEVIAVAVPFVAFPVAFALAKVTEAVD
jgi:hypothetical protein